VLGRDGATVFYAPPSVSRTRRPPRCTSRRPP
jgi:hypothetical protein